jgi:nucleotide-binding universal stress UspA family protein
MSIVIQPRQPPASRPQMHVHPVRAPAGASAARPVIAAVDGSAGGRAATAEAIASARDLGAPVVLAHVRRGPSAVWGRPFYQRRLARALRKGREAITTAAAQASAAGVEVQAEILEGPPARRIAELARSRDARLVVVGPRRRRAGASVLRSVAATGIPVLRAASRVGPAHA